MVAVGTKPHHARSLAEVLVEGDHRGHYSHGLNRMGERTQRNRGGTAAVARRLKEASLYVDPSLWQTCT